MHVLQELALATEGDRARQRAFSLQTRCVISLYERLFPLAVQDAIVLVVLSRSGDELSRHDLISESPNEWAYSPYLGGAGLEVRDACRVDQQRRAAVVAGRPALTGKEDQSNHTLILI